MSCDDLSNPAAKTERVTQVFKDVKDEILAVRHTNDMLSIWRFHLPICSIG
jgi:hypothetical protein